MKSLLTSVLTLLSVSVFAQGINFAEGDWKSVVAKAAKEKKLIYVDVYTTWCGPCKMLASNIFPQKAAGDKYNKLFVNYRIDAEKGEGIALANKYGVRGYPTHLFINPANETVVYRGSGYSPEVSHFTHEADVAMLEYKDPMTWEKYQKSFAAGKRDKKFLKEYLMKAERLGNNNDSILDAYVLTLRGKPSSEDITFLAGQIQTLDNKAVPLVTAGWNQLDPESLKAKNEEANRWIHRTYEKAVDNEDERLLGIIYEGLARYSPPAKAQAMQLYYASEYYSKVGDAEKAQHAVGVEADFLAAKSNDTYAKEDAEQAKEASASILSQLKAANVPADKLDVLLAENMDKNPDMRRQASIMAANRLNSAAWGVYEKGLEAGGDAGVLSPALNWSKRSMDLTEGMPQYWASFADTYAHLLYISGQKEQAIATQQRAVDAATKSGTGHVEELRDELHKMQSGGL